MKTLRAIATTLTLLTTASLAISGEVTQGPAIDATDLAKVLDVFSASIDYKQDEPFTKLEVGLDYQVKNPDGTFTSPQPLPYTTYSPIKPTTEQNIKILVSPTASTVIVGSASTRGHGVTPPPSSNSSWGNPPARNDDGTYTLLVYTDQSRTATPAILGQLILTIKARN